MVQGLVKATGINGTPTIRINGDQFAVSDATTPQDLINKVTQITGPVPGLAGAAAPPASPPPAPAAPAPAPAAPRDPRGAVTVAASSPAPAAEGPAEQDTRAAGVQVRPASAWWVLIAGVAGLASALTLTVEKITMLSNPSYVPSCSINPVLSCGSVMVTPQASAFGFPNPLIGIVGFTVVVVTGVLAVGRIPLPRWYWLGLAGGTALGVVFVHWLIFQSLYRIGALCPYCMVVWAVTIPLFVVVSSIALQPLGGQAVARVLYSWRWSLVALWFAALILLIIVRFWYYWSTLI